MSERTHPTPAEDAAIMQAAQAILRQEGDALLLLARQLGEATLGPDFVAAIHILQQVSGRVIVSGMGKSGHIGRKIAATLASTGSPAQFVHPGEASHGDLGMITTQDAVLALSNSGETAELHDLIHYAKRFSIPLIAITRNRASTLGKAASAVLTLPDVAEAGNLGLAPTTSTTMTLALGDALALVLVARRGFSAQDFKQFHPGGKLGQQLLRIRDIMHPGDALPLITADQPMQQALLVMTSKYFGCVGVQDGSQRLIGIITDGDLRRHMGPDLMDKKVAEVMTHHPITIGTDQLAAEALAIMNSRKITTLFAIDGDGKIAGITHIHDFLRQGLV